MDRLLGPHLRGSDRGHGPCGGGNETGDRRGALEEDRDQSGPTERGTERRGEGGASVHRLRGSSLRDRGSRRANRGTRPAHLRHGGSRSTTAAPTNPIPPPPPPRATATPKCRKSAVSRGPVRTQPCAHAQAKWTGGGGGATALGQGTAHVSAIPQRTAMQQRRAADIIKAVNPGSVRLVRVLVRVVPATDRRLTVHPLLGTSGTGGNQQRWCSG